MPFRFIDGFDQLLAARKSLLTEDRNWRKTVLFALREMF